MFLHDQSFPAIQPLRLREANKSLGRGKFGHREKQGSENPRVVVNHRQGDQGDTDALFSDDDIRFLVNREKREFKSFAKQVGADLLNKFTFLTMEIFSFAPRREG